MNANGTGPCTLPPSLGWKLMALGLLGIAFMPDSGFWLVLPQPWLVLGIARGPAPGAASGQLSV